MHVLLATRCRAISPARNNPATCYTGSVNGTESESTASQSQESSNLAGFIWAALAILLAYPLSIGPAAKFYERRGPAPAAVRAFYAPLGLAYDQSGMVKKAFDWYAALWGTHL